MNETVLTVVPLALLTIIGILITIVVLSLALAISRALDKEAQERIQKKRAAIDEWLWGQGYLLLKIDAPGTGVSTFSLLGRHELPSDWRTQTVLPNRVCRSEWGNKRRRGLPPRRFWRKLHAARRATGSGPELYKIWKECKRVDDAARAEEEF